MVLPAEVWQAGKYIQNKYLFQCKKKMYSYTFWKLSNKIQLTMTTSAILDTALNSATGKLDTLNSDCDHS